MLDRDIEDTRQPAEYEGCECHFCGNIFTEDDTVEIPHIYGHMTKVYSCVPCAIEQRNWEIQQDGESKIPEMEEVV